MTVISALDEVGMMLLVVLCVPLLLLVVGAPVALLARLVIEIAQRL